MYAGFRRSVQVAGDADVEHAGIDIEVVHNLWGGLSYE